MPTAPSTSFDLLVGEQLSAVSFVMDYVEFHFDGHVVRALTNPRVTSAGAVLSFPTKGSRDALCALIGGVVASVTFQEDIALRLSFVERGELVLPLDAAAMQGPEAL